MRKKLVSENSISLAAAKRWRRQQLNNAFREWQSTADPRPHLPGKFRPTSAWQNRWLKNIRRPCLATVLAAKSGHGDFAQYHTRYKHEDAELECPFCRKEKTPTHPWTCRTNSHRLSERLVKKLLLRDRSCRVLAYKLNRKWAAHRPGATVVETPS